MQDKAMADAPLEKDDKERLSMAQNAKGVKRGDQGGEGSGLGLHSDLLKHHVLKETRLLEAFNLDVNRRLIRFPIFQGQFLAPAVKSFFACYLKDHEGIGWNPLGDRQMIQQIPIKFRG